MALLGKRRRIDAGIDLTPLIDVVFQLLIFLMVSSQFKQPDALVELPQAGKSESEVDPDRDKVSIAIQSDGQVSVNGETVSLEELPAVIRAAAAPLTEKRAEIRGDRDSAFGVFVKVMEIARENGIDSIGVVKKNESDAPEE